MVDTDRPQLSSEEAREVLQLPEFEHLTRNQIRANYRRLALQYHPDKSGDDGAMFRLVTLASAVLTAEAEAEGDGAAGNEAFNFEEWNASYQVPTLEQILKLAMSGADTADIEHLLSMSGQHRPPKAFGMSPYPHFDEPDTSTPAAAPSTTTTLVNVKKTNETEARLRKKAQAALAELGSDSDLEEEKPVNMDAIFKNIHKDQGMDQDGNTLSDADSDYDPEGYC